MLNRERNPGAIRDALDALEREYRRPEQEFEARKSTLARELAEAEAAERWDAYQARRREVEMQAAQYHAVNAEIQRALPPILEMMRQAARLEAELDDALHSLSFEAVSVQASEGPPRVERIDWVSLIAAELRRARREAV